MSASEDETRIAQIRDASRRLVRELGFLRPTLAETDLPPSAVHALVEIGARGSMTAGELCHVLILEKSTVSRMVAKLIKAGELIEGASRSDARVKPLSLSLKGHSTLQRVDDFARHQVIEALKRMGVEAGRHLPQSLDSYARALELSRTEQKTSDGENGHE